MRPAASSSRMVRSDRIIAPQAIRPGRRSVMSSTMVNRSSRPSLALALVLLVAACGASTSEPPVEPTATATPATDETPTPAIEEPAQDEPTATAEPAAAIDAAELVDVAAATRILGEGTALDDTPAPDFGAESVTTYATPGGALLVVTVFRGTEFYGGMNALPDADPIDIGDEGIINVEENFGGVVVEFVKGELVVSLTVTPFGVEDVDALPETVEAAAREAAARLP